MTHNNFLLLLCSMLPFVAFAQTEKTDVELSEVVVTGTRYVSDIRHTPYTVTTLTRNEIEKNNMPSLLPLLGEQVPGLFLTQRGLLGFGVSGGAAGGITLRGISSSAGQMMVLIDGHPQFQGIFGHQISDSYQSQLAESVEVLRGPASAIYGSNAMGGVINIVTRKIAEDGVKTSANVGYGSYNTLQAQVGNMVKSGKFSSVVSASYNRTDGHRSNMEFEQYSGLVKLGYEISDHWKAVAEANVTHFNASNPGTESRPLLEADQEITRGETSVAIENKYGSTSGAASFFYNFGHHHINDGYNPAVASPQQKLFKSNDRLVGFSAYESTSLFSGNRVTVGFDYFHVGGHAWDDYFSGEKAGISSDYADKSMDETAGYLDFRQTIAPWLVANAGVRYDYSSQTESEEWIPAFGLAFPLPKGISLKATVSKGFRYATIRELYMFPPQNSELEPERLWNYELGYSQKIASLTLGANFYYIKADNIIQTTMVNGKPRNINTGEIENKGLELSVAYRIDDNWSVNSNYSYLDMETPVLAAPEQMLHVGGSYSTVKFEVSTGLDYVAGLYTNLDSSREYFTLWNLRVSYQLLDWLGVWARGENLLNQKYEINSGFPMPKANFMVGVKLNF